MDRCAEQVPSPLLPAEDLDLLGRVAAWPGAGSWSEWTQPVLARLAAEQGLDFATALLYERLRRSDRHGPFIRRVDSLVAKPPCFPRQLDLLLAVAPGAFYQELPRTGGDGQKLREAVAAHGCRTAVIPTHSMGTVAENGRIIRDWLGQRSGERILLASLSKGAADIKAALALPGSDTAFASVVAWLNVSGLPDGSPLANWLFARRLAMLFYQGAFWWKGLDFAVVRQMVWGPGSLLDFPLRLPAHLQLISVVGFPLRRHLCTGTLRRYHQRLAPGGPSDGLALLADVCALPGLVYPVWGADHYLRPSWDIGRLIAALAFHLAGTLDLWTVPESSPNSHRPCVHNRS